MKKIAVLMGLMSLVFTNIVAHATPPLPNKGDSLFLGSNGNVTKHTWNGQNFVAVNDSGTAAGATAATSAAVGTVTAVSVVGIAVAGAALASSLGGDDDNGVPPGATTPTTTATTTSSQ